jgi:VanZ family protein
VAGRPLIGRRRSAWMLLCCLWVCLVLFSSTSLAGQWADFAFHAIIGSSGSAMNDHFTGVLHLIADKGFHVFMFAVLALLLSQVFEARTRSTAASVLVIAGVVGISSEVLQAFFPDRDPAIRDVLINFSGALLGVLINLQVPRKAEYTA